MRNILLLAFSLFVSNAGAQQLLDAPDKRSTTFVIEMEGMTAEDAYKRAATVLMDYGWQIANSDAVLYSLNTDWIKMKGFFVRDWQAVVMVRETGGKIMVHLKANTRMDMKASNEIWGIRKSDNMEITPLQYRSNGGKDWIELKKIALQFGNKMKYL